MNYAPGHTFTGTVHAVSPGGLEVFENSKVLRDRAICGAEASARSGETFDPSDAHACRNCVRMLARMENVLRKDKV